MNPLTHLAIIWAAAFVVQDIAYVQHDLLPREAFFTLIITAFVLNVLVPVTITYWRPRYLAAVGESGAQPGSGP